ncbi:MAG: LPS biosynthesis glycosyltransferase [Leptolyngbya sp. SIO4C1]|nr:LPS biosynthesis glycosyltransferase [Leptolyngbya sp. SIO4C1]
MPTLVKTIGSTFILAYKEDTARLETALTQSGCRCEVLRQVHRPGYERYSRSYLCLLNHRQAWESAVKSDQPTLIVEADFVPVQSFDKLPPPFDPADPDLGIAWLYTCAAQIYTITSNGYAQGYSTAMVAYVVTARSAQLLIELAEAVKADPGPDTYTPWDSGIEYYLRDRGLHNYVPWRNYGEHGGLPNPEHQQNNLSTTHRADVLYGPLAFAPPYAIAAGQPSQAQWLKTRGYGRLKGLGRLLLNKYLRGPVLKGSSQPARLLQFALGRQLTLRL